MQLGFNLPISGPTSGARSFAHLAQEGEAMGYDYLTLTDHVVLPDVSVPGTRIQSWASSCRIRRRNGTNCSTATAFIAAKTSRIRLVLAVLVVPHRPAVLAAKMLSTIDVLSEGRLVVGIGAGWLKAEFDAVVTTPFAERGAVTDEYPGGVPVALDAGARKVRGAVHEVFRSYLFASAGAATVSGDMGGRGERSLVASRGSIGDAWYPIGSNNKALLDTLPRLAAGIGRLRKLTAEAGRDPAAVTVVFRVKRYGDAVAPVASDGERRLFSGSDAEIVADLRALAELGVRRSTSKSRGTTRRRRWPICGGSRRRYSFGSRRVPRRTAPKLTLPRPPSPLQNELPQAPEATIVPPRVRRSTRVRYASRRPARARQQARHPARSPACPHRTAAPARTQAAIECRARCRGRRVPLPWSARNQCRR